MTFLKATILTLKELRVRQQSLGLNFLSILQHQRRDASIRKRLLLEQVERETLEQAERQAKREALKQGEREQLEQAEREQLEQAIGENLEHERIARLWRFLEYLSLLLLSILRFLLGCSKFGGFQNRQRPRCTTMPWNIWPSLVVLWGVCWMFINTPFVEFDATQFNSAFDDEQLPLFVPSKTFPSTREILQMH
jgi:hypothetical protein